jgi:malonyl CoA-acyl carrier protein transacylase
MTDEFENALAWICSAPSEWIESGRKNLAAGAEWIWEVLQGDFNENASTAQVVTGTVISMIPFVDQICDVRDLVANCKSIKEEPDNSLRWVSLVLTLIGLFPALGSLFKGCFKVMFASMRKIGGVSGVTPRIALQLDEAVAQLNRFLDRPEVVKTLKALKWDNPYKILATNLRALAAKLNTGALLSAFNEARNAAESLISLVKKWGSSAMANKAEQLIETIAAVHRKADRKLAEAVKPVQDYLTQLAQRLDIDADMAHRAYLNTANPHAFKKLSEAEEMAAIGKAKPGWVDTTGMEAYPALGKAPPAQPGWPSTSAYDTFHIMHPVTIPPGTKLYRIVDPKSKDNSICWMTEAEFRKLKSKDDWRRRFAVWANWNSNGEFITYTVPPGPGLKVWEGVTASQKMKSTSYVLEGGAVQLVVDPSHLGKVHISPRQKTGWGYDELGTTNNLVGVPVQMNNWGI